MNAQQHMQTGLIALQTGKLDAAETALQSALTLAPNNPDALQLLGMLEKARGRNDVAVSYLRRSLKALAAQPHVLNNLANLLAQSDSKEAQTLYREAIVFKPDYPDALANLAAILVKSDDIAQLSEAVSLTSTALSLNPNHVLALETASLAALRTGDGAKAQDFATRATALAPNRAIAWHRLGDALLNGELYMQASQAYAKALHFDARLDASWAGYSACMRHLQDTAKAEEAAIRAIEINPSNLFAHDILNGLLWTSGRHGAHLGSYRNSIALVPTDDNLKLAMAGELFRLGAYEEAGDLVQACLKSAPEWANANELAGRLAAQIGDFDVAVDRFTNVLKVMPDTVSTLNYLCDAYLAMGQYQKALHWAERTVARHADHQDGWARLALAYKMSDDPRYDWLYDYDRLVKTVDLVAPDNQPTSSFFADLAEYLRTRHTARVQPLDQTLRHGTQTFGQLLAHDNHPLVVALAGMLADAANAYSAALPNDDQHPFLRRNTGSVAFSGSWSARLGKGGFHSNHLHPQGWLSSACYIALPEEVSDPVQQAGWFKLGQSNLDLGGKDVPDRLIEPRVARLILFPSYMWHGTTPFVSGEERLTVAFDALPVMRA
jgi:tetratricopeptide (TPR) repeat protein